MKSILVLLVFANLKLASAQGVSEQLDPNSIVDWERLVIRSSGNSAIASQGSDSERVAALEKAKMSAEENLLKAAQLLPLTANSIVGDATQSMISNLRDLVKRFIIVDTRSMSDMTLEVDVELPFTGEFASMLLPADVGHAKLLLGSEPLCPTCGQPWPKGKPVPEGVKLIIPAEGYLTRGGKPFTGLLIDARELDVSPAFLPQIVNDESVEVYGLGYVRRAVVVNTALVAYRNDFEQARRDARIGRDPLIIRAIGAAGQRKSNIVVSNSDAVLIHAAAKSRNFLKDGKVIIVL